MAAPSAWAPTWRGGKRLTRRDWAIVDDVSKAVGVKLVVVQGSWSGGVRASAGTHSGAGAIDISVRGMSRAKQLEVVNEFRKRNGAAWLRSPEFGWNQPRNIHIHVIIKDTPGLSYGARRQVINYNSGLNGLASKRRDPHPRPAQTKFALPGQHIPTTSSAVYVKIANLKYGKTNDDVKDLQRRLKVAPDGFYGPVTDDAVRAHQRKMKLTPDPKGKSFVGPKQAEALGLTIINT